MKKPVHAQAQTWIETLQLQPHPEGGWYRESYRALTDVQTPGGLRPAGTAIFFLLAGTDVSHFHRLQADEIWHFYAGGPLTIHLLSSQGYQSLPLGPEALQAVVPAHTWFAANLNTDLAFALVGCTMAPGFVFEDFELADKQSLLSQFPAQAELIEALTLA